MSKENLHREATPGNRSAALHVIVDPPSVDIIANDYATEQALRPIANALMVLLSGMRRAA